MSAPVFSNPEGVHAPVGGYSHTAVVPAGTRMLYISGQVGLRPDGSVPETMAEQADQTFANVIACLRGHGLAPSSIVKLTVFMVAGQSASDMRKARAKHLGEHKPTSTAIFVSQLVDPRLLIEVEAVAAMG